MTFVLQDRIKVSSTSVGTGTFTLGVADPGFQDFTSIGDGNQTYYTIINESSWEVGIGTYTVSGTTLSRDTVLASSNNNSLVDWQAGTKTVYVPQPAENAQGSAPTADNGSISSNLVAWENFQKKLQRSYNANVAFKNNNTVGIVSTYTGLNTSGFAAAGGGNMTMGGEIIFFNSGRIYKISRTGVISTIALVNSTTYVGGVLAPNGDIHFAPTGGTVGQKISASGVVSTYSLVSTVGRQGYGGVLGPNGDVYFAPNNTQNIGTKISVDGVVSTYALLGTANRYNGGVLAPTGDIYFVPNFGLTNHITKISSTGVVSTLTFSKTVATNEYSYAGGAIDINGNVHFVPSENKVGTKISITGVVSTYSLVMTSTSPTNEYFQGGVLAPSGDIHFLRTGGSTSISLTVGQKVSSNGVVSTYSKLNTADFMEGGVLTPNGDIIAPARLTQTPTFGFFKISINPAIPFELDTCISPFLNKF